MRKSGRFFPLSALLAGGFWACSAVPLRPGLYNDGVVIEAQGRSLVEAQRRAVDAALGAFLSPRSREEFRDVIDARVLSGAASYIKKYKIVEEKEREGVPLLRVKAYVLARKLALELERLGLLRRAANAGRPKVLISLKEAGPGSGEDVGRCSGALRRALIGRGYSVFDLSDDMVSPMAGKHAGDAAKAAEAAKTLGADIIVTGSARAVESPRPGLDGFFSYTAVLELSVSTGPGSLRLSQEASAVDPAAEGAAGKALENAGELAAGRLAGELSGRLKEQHEISVLVIGMRDFSEIKKLIEDVRGASGIAGAALDAVAPRESRLRIFTEKDADDVMILLAGLPRHRFKTLLVESDYIEVATGGEAD